MSKKIILFTLMAALFAGLSYAQMGQVGAIRGTVTIKNEGAPLPGANVTLRSPAMVLPSMSAMTNDKGQYRFINLSPGVYELTFEISGFGMVIRKDIVVNSNMTFTVDIAMSPERVEEAITVTGQAPTIDRQSTAKTTTLDRTFLASVPAGRDLNYLLTMTAGVVMDPNEGASTQGATVRDNLYAVDGIQINDPSVGTITGNPLSIEIMEEVSIQAGGAGAEWGAAKGGIMNIVTKSGGNRFSGDTQLLYEHESFKSDNTKGIEGFSGTTGNKLWMEPSFSLGGPVMKDKLWFFANFTYRGSERFIPGFPFDGPEMPIKDKSFNPYLKLTLQTSPADKFVVGLSYQKRDVPASGGSSRFRNMDSVRDVFRTTIIPSFHWIHTWGPRFVTNLKIGFLSYKWDFAATANGDKALYWEWTTRRSYNGYGFDDLYQRTRFQVNADGTLFVDDLAGSHEIKFGIQNSLHYTRRLANVFGPEDSGGLGLVNLYLYKGVPYEGEWAASFRQLAKCLNSGVFINDVWNVSKKLTLNLGLRFDYNKNYTPKQKGTLGDFPAVGNLAHIGAPDLTWDMDIEKSVNIYSWNTLSPRLGLIYDVTGDGKTLLKANFSQYLQDNYTATTWFVSNVGWVWVYGATDPAGNLTDVYGAWVPGSNMKIGYPGKPLVAPRTYEAIVAVERELFEDVSLALRYVRRWDRKLIEDVDAASLDIDALMKDGTLVWDSSRWTPVDYTDTFDGRTVTFFADDWRPGDLYLVNPPGLKRDYEAFEFSLKKRFSRGWSFGLSYVYSKATGLVQSTYWESELDEPLFNDPNYHVNAQGQMYMDRPHQFKLAGTAKGPLGINISSFIRYLSGMASRRTINSYDVGFDFNETQAVQPYGAFRYPSQFLIDFRLEKEFRFGDSLTLRVFGDAFNITNSNKITDWETSSSSSYKFHAPYTILDPRTFRLGAKIEFNL